MKKKIKSKWVFISRKTIMKLWRKMGGVLLLFCCFSVSAASQRVTATITVTNTPSFPNTITVNGNARTWTNNATPNPSGTILIGADRLISATNLANQIFSTPYSGGVNASFSSGSNIVLQGAVDQAMVVTSSGTWGSIVLTTQAVTSAYGVRVPMATEPTASVRTNIASLLVNDLSTYPSNQFQQASTAFAQLLGTTNAQTVSGAKAFIGVNTHSNSFWFNGVISNAVALQLSGVISNATVLFSRLTNGSLDGFTLGMLTNGVLTNAILVNPKMTNGIAYGVAFSSPGSGTLSEEFGAGANAAAGFSTAIGASASAQVTAATAVGNTALAYGSGATAIGAFTLIDTNSGFSTALGYNATAQNSSNSVAIGINSSVQNSTNSMAIGPQALVNGYTNSVALGKSATATDNNQIMLGTASISTYVNSFLQVGVAATNITFTGTNNWRGDVAYVSAANANLANGNNSGIILGTNVYIKLTGSTTIANIAGFAAERDGSFHIVEISGNITNNILDSSGLDATAANRIVTGTAGTIISTNQPCLMEVIYNAAAARWRVISIR